MSVAARMTAAIGRVGGWIAVGAPGNREFLGSLQPRGGGAELSGSGGFGTEERFVLYACWGAVTQGLEPGDLLWFLGERFQIKQMETVTLKGQPAYRKGWVVAV